MFNRNQMQGPGWGGCQNQMQDFPNMQSVFGSAVQNQQFQPLSPQQVQPQTNKFLVTSLEEALTRNAPLNSKIVYTHQDENLEFEIFTDMTGRKTYTVFKRIVESDDTHKQGVGVSREEYLELREKIKNLEKKLEVANAKTTNAAVGATSNAEM